MRNRSPFEFQYDTFMLHVDIQHAQHGSEEPTSGSCAQSLLDAEYEMWVCNGLTMSKLHPKREVVISSCHYVNFGPGSKLDSSVCARSILIQLKVLHCCVMESTSGRLILCNLC